MDIPGSYLICPLDAWQVEQYNIQYIVQAEHNTIVCEVTALLEFPVCIVYSIRVCVYIFSQINKIASVSSYTTLP